MKSTLTFHVMLCRMLLNTALAKRDAVNGESPDSRGVLQPVHPLSPEEAEPPSSVDVGLVGDELLLLLEVSDGSVILVDPSSLSTSVGVPVVPSEEEEEEEEEERIKLLKDENSGGSGSPMDTNGN